VPLSRNLGTLTSCNLLGHSRPVTGPLYLYFSIISPFFLFSGVTASHRTAVHCAQPELNNSLSLCLILNRERLFCFAILADRSDLLSGELNSMQQSPAVKANSFSVSQEIPRNLWHQKVYYFVHKIPPLVPIPSQINPIHFPHFISLKPILL